MARHRTKILPPVDLVSDMADLLDLAGVDAVDKPHLDRVLHSGYSAESLLEFADATHRQQKRRIKYSDLMADFLGVKP